MVKRHPTRYFNGNDLLLPDVHDWFRYFADEQFNHVKEDVDTSKRRGFFQSSSGTQESFARKGEGSPAAAKFNILSNLIA